MKKTVFAGLLIAVVVAAFGTSSAVFAQAPDTDPVVPGTNMSGRSTGLRQYADPVGRMGDPNVEGLGLLEEGQIAYAAQELGLSAEEIEARLSAGETLAGIAMSVGVEDYIAFVEAARNFAREQLLADGLDIPGWYGGKGANGQGAGVGGQNLKISDGLGLNSDVDSDQAGNGRGRLSH